MFRRFCWFFVKFSGTGDGNSGMTWCLAGISTSGMEFDSGSGAVEEKQKKLSPANKNIANVLLWQ